MVGTPIWAGTLPPASRTYITENKSNLKNTAFLSVSGKGSENKKALPHFELLSGKKASSSLMITESEVRGGAFKEKINAFSEEITGKTGN